MKASRARYAALTLLFLTGVLNLFDRQIVNILAQDIKVSLHISDAQLGLLTGTAFGLLYAILGIPLGRLADRVDRVKMMSVILVLWSAFTAVCGAAASFTQLFFARVGVGVGEAGSQPASTALISDFFPVERRTSAMSILLASAPVGGFLGLLVGGYVGSRWGWRTAFVVAGMPGLILAGVMALTLRDPRSSPSLRGSALAQSLPPSVSLIATARALLSRRRFRWLAAGLICVSFFPYASGAWLPVFFIRVHGLTTAQIGRFAALAVGLGGALGTLGSGFVCDLLRPRVREVELTVLALALGLGLVTLLLTLFAANRSAALVSMFFFNLCAYAFLGPIVTQIQAEAPPDSRALAIALCVSLSNITILGLALPAVGFLSDALKARHGPESIRYALAMAALVAGVLGLFAFWRARRSGS
jgi:predicted MFS family arabinose efflux permease